jgi:hypothetical protein
MSEVDSVWGGTLLSAAADFDFELGFELEVGSDSEHSDDPTLLTNLNQKNQVRAGKQRQPIRHKKDTNGAHSHRGPYPSLEPIANCP